MTGVQARSGRRIGRDALVRWFEGARVAVEHTSFGAVITSRERSRIRMLLVTVAVEVSAPLTVAGPYRVGMGVTHLGTSSFTYASAVFAGPLDGLAELHLDVLGYPTCGPLDGLAPSSLRVDYLAEVHYPGIYQLRVGWRRSTTTPCATTAASSTGPAAWARPTRWAPTGWATRRTR